MLRGGITCFNDMYFYPEAAAQAALASGMRATLGIIVIEMPSAYAADAQDYLSKGLAARDALKNEPLLSFCIAPHAPYTVSDKTFERIAMLAGRARFALAHPRARDARRDRAEPGPPWRATSRPAAGPRPGGRQPDCRSCRPPHGSGSRPARGKRLPCRPLPQLEPEARQRHSSRRLAC